MKRLKFFLAIMFCLVACVLNAQIETNITWEYPIKPGSYEWKMTSYDEKVEKSQPPKELMERWDTETLFKYCVAYPFNHVILMFNNPNDGFRRAYEQATVWQVFIRRNNAVDAIGKYFEAHPYKILFEMDNIKVRNGDLLTMYFLEKLVSETDFTTLIDSFQKRKLMEIMLESHQSKKEFPDDIFGFPYNSSLCAILKILESDQVMSSNDEISMTTFRKQTRNESFVDDNMDAAITAKALDYLNK